MKEFHHHKFCPIRDILSRIGSKWSMLVLVTLDANGTMRFNEIQKSIGDISQRMLTLTVRTLESDGLIKRDVYPEVPPRVEYTLTDRGRTLMPLLKELVRWALDNQEQILEERAKLDVPEEVKE